ADDPRLDPQDVPGLAADGSSPGLAKSLPEPAEIRRRGPDVVSLLPRLLRPDDAHPTRAGRRRENVPPPGDVGHRRADRLLDGLPRRRARAGENPGGGGHVLELRPLREEVPVDRAEQCFRQRAVRLQDEAIREAVDYEERGDFPVDIQERRLVALAGT